MGRDVLCACGTVVKVNNYGVKAKKNKKNIQFSSVYDDTKYQCSKCRGIIIEKKKKGGRHAGGLKQDVGKREASSRVDSKSKGAR
jgi:hypothetical protein